MQTRSGKVISIVDEKFNQSLREAIQKIQQSNIINKEIYIKKLQTLLN